MGITFQQLNVSLTCQQYEFRAAKRMATLGRSKGSYQNLFHVSILNHLAPNKV
jgi:hypothetical protein